MGEYETSNLYTEAGESGQVWQGPTAKNSRRGNWRIIHEGRRTERLGRAQAEAVFNADQCLARADQLIIEGRWDVPEGMQP